MDKPDSCIINVGTNDIGKQDPFIIAEDIIKIVNICQEHGCNKVYISTIVYRHEYQDAVIQLNNILRAWQAFHEYKLIYNDNIDYLCISYDKIHLDDKEKKVDFKF